VQALEYTSAVKRTLKDNNIIAEKAASVNPRAVAKLYKKLDPRISHARVFVTAYRRLHEY